MSLRIVGFPALAAVVCSLALGMGGNRAAAQESNLARYVPAEDVAIHFEYGGIAAHQDAWDRTAFARLLESRGFGAEINRLLRSLVEQAPVEELEPVFGDEPVESLAAVLNHARLHGAIVAFHGPIDEDGPDQFVAVFRGVADEHAAPAVRALADWIRAGGDGDVEPEERFGRTIYINRNTPSEGIWFEGPDLILTNWIDGVVETIEGERASLLDHPRRRALAERADGFEPLLIAFADFSALPPMPDEARELGFDRFERLEFVWGLDGDAFRSEMTIAAPAPWTGFLTLLDQPTFGPADMPSLPEGQTAFAVYSIDPERVYDGILELFRTQDPDMLEQARGMEAGLAQQFGVRFREDVLQALGPRIVVYQYPADPEAEPAPEPRRMAGPAFAVSSLESIDRLVIRLELRKRAAFVGVLETAVQVANQVFERQAQGPRGAAPRIVNEGTDEEPVYVLKLPEGMLPPMMPDGFEPTIVLEESELVVAGSKRAALDRGAPWKPEGELEPIAELMTDNMMALIVFDPRETLAESLAMLPEFLESIDQMAAAAGGPPEGLGLEFDPEAIPDKASW